MAKNLAQQKILYLTHCNIIIIMQYSLMIMILQYQFIEELDTFKKGNDTKIMRLVNLLEY